MPIKIPHTGKSEDRLPMILSFLLPVVIMVGIFAGKGIYPFGENSFLRTDLYHQYAPFFAEFARALKEGASMTYA
ncbi:MAG: YfhO family protein, partial [Lachnospiraceae bacterium]|nr:YfhO family protein [Lachnospiraceae bacterium]